MRGLAVRHPDVQVAFILLGGQPGHLDVIIAFILLGRQLVRVKGVPSIRDPGHLACEPGTDHHVPFHEPVLQPTVASYAPHTGTASLHN